MIVFDNSYNVGYNYKSQFFVQDDFGSGFPTSGNAGTLGWLTTGTLSSQASEADHYGIIRCDTGAVSSTNSRMSFQNSGFFEPDNLHHIIWIIRLNTNDTNTTCRFGAGSSVASSPPTHGIYLEKLDNDTNWFVVTRASGSETRTDTGQAIAVSFVKFEYRRNSAGVHFYLNGTRVTTHLTNIPTSMICPYAFIINSAAAAKTFDTDYFEFDVRGMVR